MTTTFMACVFIDMVNKSNIFKIVAIAGAELLRGAHVGILPLCLLVIFITTLVNPFMTSNSSKWLLIAPMIVPMFVMLNVHPAYAQDPNRKFDMKLEPMIPVIRGEKALKIHCYAPLDIVTAVRICDEFHLKFTLDHVTCGVEVLDFLQKRPEIPLLLGPSLGARDKVELHGKGFANVVKLAENRDVCLITDAPMIPLQYLPICAGLAISKGMPYERALEAVTINPARVMGVEARVGSLDPGKDADLVIRKDRSFVVIQDPVAVFINGERI